MIKQQIKKKLGWAAKIKIKNKKENENRNDKLYLKSRGWANVSKI